MAKARNPLEPLATVSGVLVTLVGLGLAVVVAATIFGTGSVLGLGRNASICVDVNGVTSLSDGRPAGYHPEAGVSPATTGYRFCADHPSVGQRTWYTVLHLPATLLFVGALLLVFLLVREAARNGIHTPATARRLHVLGWFLLAGAVLQVLVEQIASGRLLATMVTEQPRLFGDAPYHVGWAVLLAGVGVLSFARIVRVGAVMREDLEGTV